MKLILCLSALALVAALNKYQYGQGKHAHKRYVYPTVTKTRPSDANFNEQCPVTCEWSRGRIRVEHHHHAGVFAAAKHHQDAKDGSDNLGLVGSTAANAVDNIYHRCYHRSTVSFIADATHLDGVKVNGGKTGTRTCQCQCAQWQCGASNTPECHFGGVQIPDEKCVASQQPVCTSAPTNYPTKSPTKAATYQKGTVNFEYGATGTKCKVFNFPEAFSTVPRIAITVNHRLYTGTGTHESMTAWSEWATTTQFKACGRELNGDDFHDTYNFDYVAWEGNQIGAAEATGWVTPQLSAGTQCWTRNFDQTFSSSPIVVASVDHTNINEQNGYTSTHDAISLWIEGITATNFKVCTTESKYNSIGGHNPITINYIALKANQEYALTDTHGRSGKLAGGATIQNTACLTVNYGKTYATAPIVLATVNHATYNNAGIHDSFISWTENIGKSSFRFCGRESNFNDGPHDGSTYVDWAVIV